MKRKIKEQKKTSGNSIHRTFLRKKTSMVIAIICSQRKKKKKKKRREFKLNCSVSLQEESPNT